jgi:hypothetical protein
MLQVAEDPVRRLREERGRLNKGLSGGAARAVAENEAWVALAELGGAGLEGRAVTDDRRAPLSRTLELCSSSVRAPRISH